MAQHTLSVLVENSPGVLARVASLLETGLASSESHSQTEDYQN